MARNRIYYAVELVAAALCYVLYEKWFSWFFLTAVLLAPILSVLLSIPTALRLRVELQCPETVQRGREAIGHLQLAGSFLRPACVVRLNIRSFLAGEQTERRLRLTSANALQLLLPTEHCDVLELSVKKVRIYDFLGLFTLPASHSGPACLTVLPRLRDPEPKPDTSRLEHPPLRPMAPGTFAEVHELRDYRPGDSLRDVHWKLTAKTDNLVVREPLGPEALKALITLDLGGTPDQRDEALERFLWLAQWMLDRSSPFCVRWAGPEGNVWIRTPRDLDLAILSMLRSPAEDGGWLRVGDRSFTWHCHLDGKEDDHEGA